MESEKSLEELRKEHITGQLVASFAQCSLGIIQEWSEDTIVVYWFDTGQRIYYEPTSYYDNIIVHQLINNAKEPGLRREIIQ